MISLLISALAHDYIVYSAIAGTLAGIIYITWARN